MPFLTGEVKTLPGQPPDIDQLRQDLAAYLQGQIPGGGGGGGFSDSFIGRMGSRLFPNAGQGGAGAAPGTGIDRPISPQEPSDFFIQNILGPTQDLFTQRRGESLAQAKESAGTLTGSGMAHTLGTTVNRSLTEEQGVLAQLINAELTRTQQGSMLEAQLLNQLMLGMSTSGVGPPQNVYQPGFLDYLFQGAGQAAPIFAGAGGGGRPGVSGTSYVGSG